MSPNAAPKLPKPPTPPRSQPPAAKPKLEMIEEVDALPEGDDGDLDTHVIAKDEHVFELRSIKANADDTAPWDEPAPPPPIVSSTPRASNLDAPDLAMFRPKVLRRGWLLPRLAVAAAVALVALCLAARPWKKHADVVQTAHASITASAAKRAKPQAPAAKPVATVAQKKPVATPASAAKKPNVAAAAKKPAAPVNGKAQTAKPGAKAVVGAKAPVNAKAPGNGKAPVNAKAPTTAKAPANAAANKPAQ